MSDLASIRGQIQDRRDRLAAIFEQAGPAFDMSKVTLIEGDSAAKVDHIRALDAELADLRASEKKAAADESEIADIAARTRYLDEPDNAGRAVFADTDPRQARPAAAKSIGQLFIESAAYKNRPRGMGNSPQSLLDADIQLGAAVFQQSAGWAPESLRTGRVVPFATRPIQVTDLFEFGTISYKNAVYMEETTFTNAAAERAEAAVYAESAFALTQRSQAVEVVGTSVPVTDEQLEDVDQAQSYLDGRVRFSVLQRLDGQLMNGNGTTPNILGILNASGIQTQAKGVDPTPDAIYKAMQKIRVIGRAFPNSMVIHPDDWTDIRLLRTADGIYIWGNPAEPKPDVIWGLVVAQCDAITVNTAVVGDFSPMMVQPLLRRGLEVQVGYVNDDFQKGKQTIRAGLRVVNQIFRGAAFCTVTGI